MLHAALLFNAYSGRFTVEEARIHHDVEIALFPDWVGKRLTRAYRFEAERLILSFGAAGRRDSLQWKRLRRGDR